VSDLGLGLGHGHDRRPAHSRRPLGCLAVLLALVVVVGGGYVAYSFGVSALKDKLSPPADYSGSGSGKVLVEVKDGDAATDIAATLVSKDVVKSVGAFTDAAKNDPKSVGIQVGFYELRKKMSAASALAVLVQPDNRMRNVVTIPEGLRVDQVVDLLVKKTKFSQRQYDKVLARPSQIGLPSYAKNNAEGYLFPATYEIAPNATPRSILASMVTRYESAVSDLDVQKKAAALGYSAHDVMTVASMVQAEGRLSADFPKIARVLYNRLEQDKKLQLDTTIVYIFKTKGKLTTTSEQRQSASRYNTYRYAGLPPGPIAAPGEAAIKAALEPADGSWLFFVTTDPSNGAMSFATTYEDHLKNVRKFRVYCQTHDC
jgi:peptidoglycan lytic transglycosylase G